MEDRFRRAEGGFRRATTGPQARSCGSTERPPNSSGCWWVGLGPRKDVWPFEDEVPHVEPTVPITQVVDADLLRVGERLKVAELVEAEPRRLVVLVALTKAHLGGMPSSDRVDEIDGLGSPGDDPPGRRHLPWSTAAPFGVASKTVPSRFMQLRLPSAMALASSPRSVPRSMGSSAFARCRRRVSAGSGLGHARPRRYPSISFKRYDITKPSSWFETAGEATQEP